MQSEESGEHGNESRDISEGEQVEGEAEGEEVDNEF